MQRALFNRAAMRVAETKEVSGRVTAEPIKHERLFERFLLAAGAMLLSLTSYGQTATTQSLTRSVSLASTF